MENEASKKHEDSSEVYLCSGCGGNMEFDIAAQKLKCPYCQTELDIQEDRSLIKEYDFNDVANREANSTWNDEVSVIKCESCGAESVVEKDQTALYCSYCGSSHVLDSKQSAGIRPEGILPFKVDKNKTRELFDKWIRSRWLAPGKLKKLYQSDKLKSVYVPYWTYDSDTDNSYTAEGGEVYYVTVERDGKKVKERKVRWYRVSGRFKRFFDDVQVNASKNFNETLMRKIEPFNTKELEPYKPQYISGYTAERYSIGVVECFEAAKGKMKDALTDDVRSMVLKRYDEVRNIRIDTRYSNVTYKHVLLPVWTAQYDYNGKKYRYMINGQNGRVSGQSPLSPVKIALLILLGIAAVIAYLYFSGNLQGSSEPGLLYNSYMIYSKTIETCSAANLYVL